MRWVLLLEALLVIVLFTLWLGREHVLHWSAEPHLLAQPLEVVLEPRQSLKDFARTLETAGVIDSSLRFRIFIRSFDDYHHFQAGRYRFAESVAPQEVAAMVRAGKIYTPIVLQISIPEGFTLAKIAERLEEAGIGPRAETLALAQNPQFLASHKIHATNAEGYLYPATYSFAKLPSTTEVLTLLATNFWQRLPQDYASRAEALGLSLHQAIIFASLIELESAVPEERRLIAGVIWNRLKRHMPLGIDASIIYGIAGYDGNIRYRDLHDASNPYNTRIHPGLPPTPICSPSVESLLAVVAPSEEGYLYYVLDPDLGHRHHFSKTLDEHNRYVQKLRRAR